MAQIHNKRVHSAPHTRVPVPRVTPRGVSPFAFTQCLALWAEGWRGTSYATHTTLFSHLTDEETRHRGLGSFPGSPLEGSGVGLTRCPVLRPLALQCCGGWEWPCLPEMGSWREEGSKWSLPSSDGTCSQCPREHHP